MKRKNKIVAIQGDLINTMNPKTDTTLLLALEAQRRGYKIYYYETKSLTYENGKVHAFCNEVVFYENRKKFYSVIRSKKIDLSKARFILMRQNPPFNMDYITATFLLEKIPKPTLVVNDPKAVRNMPEKLHSIEFLKLMPATIFTSSIDAIDKFRKKHKKIVIKPTHGYGGKNILFINKKSKRKKILNYINQHGQVMVQKFLPKIKHGDKRIFILNGTVKGAIRRIPSKGSILSNISQGGTAVKTRLNKKEYYLANFVAKKLKQNNIFFAGIDLISNYLIGDINVTSPTGLPQYKNLSGINLAKNFWNEAEKLK